ncbi:sigma-70 family RNA polymerase sigma factor [Streptomyces nitrosporeus]|uniref:sigma-70 family RNA polymerase sigma factor n=1 Tax=Streptomyces nitrosporeus TaxID=28894 RepID=UPI00332E44F5
MGEGPGTAWVEAAQAGDEQARERLVASCLPLIHNIVGRALNGHADVDDVVQESVLHLLRGLPGLRDPGSFRSWAVAITMNQIRRHWRERGPSGLSADGLREAHEVVDPSADFVGLTIIRLGLTGQRRETAQATRWLEEDDRDLLALWWLEAAGQLTRSEVAEALGLSARHTAVRVQRMKAQLEAARVVVRALKADPPCVLLEDLTAGWDGAPSALWRKRLARHARDCTVCSGHRSGLVPVEGLLAGLALVVPTTYAGASGAGRAAYAGGSALTPAGHAGGPEPAAYAGGGAGVTGDLPVPGPVHAPGAGRAERRRNRIRRRRRNTVVAALAAVGTLGGGGAAVHLCTDGPGQGAATAAGTLPGPPDGAPDAPAPPPSPSPSVSPAPASPSSPSPSPKASRSRSASSAPPSAPGPRPPSSAPPATPAPGRTEERTESPSVADQVVRLVNAERAEAGCGAVSGNSLLAKAASRHSADMAARDYFSHTSPDGTDPGARITTAGYRWSTYGENIAKGQSTAAAVMEAWMNSPGHRANILDCAFEEIGVGVEDSPEGPVWTQNFGTAL